MSARPARIGATSFGISDARYWLSASRFTITSAPSFSAASMPAWNAAASPLLLVSRTRWSVCASQAISAVPSVEPSSITRNSTVVEALDPARQLGEHAREGLRLVQAGDLDHELHGNGDGRARIPSARDDPPLRLLPADPARGPGRRRVGLAPAARARRDGPPAGRGPLDLAPGGPPGPRQGRDDHSRGDGRDRRRRSCWCRCSSRRSSGSGPAATRSTSCSSSTTARARHTSWR